MFVVNCSWLLKTGWIVVKGFLDSKTRKKIRILGEDYKGELLKYIDKENLPEFLGGTCQCKPHGCLMQPAGPWEEYYNSFPKDSDMENFNIPPPPPKWKVPE